MRQFEKVLDIEKHYDQRISKAKKKIETDYDNSIEMLNIERDAKIDDIKKDTEREFKRRRKEAKERGENLLRDSNGISEKILRSVNRDEVSKKIVKDLFGVGK